ncbi:MAG TPA: glycosyltransferase, partial [Bacteroidales bacterium]|nr:glycosyltransferase [Bacteroidales bacterium]
RSSFNLVIQDYEVPPEFIRAARDRGFEIGIHGLKHTWDIYRSEKAFAGQAVQINKHLKQWGAKGFRSPSMLHNLDYIHHLDVDYDASTFDTDPFEPQPDGMATIFPFWVPGHNSRQRGYVELPYTLPQDFLLYVIMREKGIEIWRKKLDWIAGHGGMALFITHPDYMNFNGLKPGHSEYPYRYYEEFLHYVKTRYEGMYWQALPEDMSRFWAQNYARSEERAKPPIRACMVAYSFYELDNRVMRYAETLAKRGDSVDVIALGKPGAPGFENIRGVNVYRIQTRKIDEKGRISYMAKLFRFLFNSSIFLTKKHLSLPYDLIHVHSVPDFEVFAAVFPKLRGAKVILDIHDIVPEFYASKFREGKDSSTFRILAVLERLSAEFSDHVIISNHIWEKTLLSRSVDQHRCSVIMNYPDESIFYRRPRKRNDDKFNMLYPGTMGKHQGLDLAIKAFAKVKNQIPKAEFHIYGQGQEKENLLRLIAALGLENEVFVRDIIPIDRIAEVMANADLGVIPKTNDPFGGDAFSTKTLEFMSLGVPLIVSATRIDKFYFNDSVVMFFNPGDENDLAGCMLRLARDEGLRNRLRENALSYVKSYSWEKRKFEYLDLVDSLVRKQHGIPQGNR